MGSKQPRTARDHILIFLKRYGASYPRDIVKHFTHLNPDTLRWTMSKVMIPKNLAIRDESGLYALTSKGLLEAEKLSEQQTTLAPEPRAAPIGVTARVSGSNPYIAIQDIDLLVRKHGFSAVMEALQVYKRIREL